MLGAVLKTTVAFALSTNIAWAKTGDGEAPLLDDDTVKTVVVPFDVNGCTSDKIRVFTGFSIALQTRDPNPQKHIEPTTELFHSLDRSLEEFLKDKTVNNLRAQETFLSSSFFTTVVPDTGAKVEQALREVYPDAAIVYPFRIDSLKAKTDPNCRTMESLDPS